MHASSGTGADLRSAALTGQLLAFSRKQAPAAQVLDPNALVTGIIGMLQRLMGADIKLVTQLKPDIGRVDIDPSQFEQIVMNLVLNARDAMPVGGRVVVETSIVTFTEPTAAPDSIPVGRDLKLAVSDVGVGMPPDIQKRIFEPLFTTKAKGRGTGLGLATLNDIVRKAAGRILVFSAVDKGTVFKVYLPATEPGAPLPDPAPMATGQVSGQEVVLLVEDDPDVREFASVAISQFGFQVISAASGAEALAPCHAQGARIRVLVTDLVMPVMSGQALIKQARRLVAGLRVLFGSGYPEDVLDRSCLDCCAEAFLEKPFSSSELGRAIRVLPDA